MKLAEMRKRIKSFFGRNSDKNNVPVLGRYEPDEIEEMDVVAGDLNEAIKHDEPMDELDHGVPSVNKRSLNTGNLRNILGLLAVAGVAYGALFLGSRKPTTPVALMQSPASQLAPAPISNPMPPLIMPDPPAPLVMPHPQASRAAVVEPIAVKTLPVAPKEPDWVSRKITAGVLLGDQAGSPIKNEINVSPQHKKADVVEGDTGLMSTQLKPMVTKGVSAGILSNRNYLIAKGTTLDCALETAINSTFSGLVTCRLTRDVYSDNGRVIMLDRGSQLIGEYKSGIDEGMVRIFVLWTRAKTPKGVVVELNSPGTDALGRTGFEGFVDNHFLERFGAVIMLSMVQESFDYAKAGQAKPNTGTTIQTGPIAGAGVSSGVNTMDKMGSEMLKKFVNIPPVFYMNQGAHMQVMVVRDLDFSSVYGVDLKD